MKTCLLTIYFFVCSLHNQSNLYDIHFEGLGSGEINMQNFQNKRIVVVPVGGASAGIELLERLDSLQKSAPDSLVVIAVPAIDLDSTINEGQLISLRTSLNLSLLIGKPGSVKKNALNNQHALFKWLTNIGENSHFDRDVDEAGQLFIISKKGTLYGILGNQSSATLINEVLSATVND